MHPGTIIPHVSTGSVVAAGHVCGMHGPVPARHSEFARQS
jgi:hypothetical protein